MVVSDLERFEMKDIQKGDSRRPVVGLGWKWRRRWGEETQRILWVVVGLDLVKVLIFILILPSSTPRLPLTPPLFLPSSTKDGSLHAWNKKKRDHNISSTPRLWFKVDVCLYRSLFHCLISATLLLLSMLFTVYYVFCLSFYDDLILYINDIGIFKCMNSTICF